MTIRTILQYPDRRLSTIATPVTVFDNDLKRLVDDMFETMYEYRGIGLAATQIDVHQQVIVIDLQQNDTREPLTLINPNILSHHGNLETNQEGCLSVPEIYDSVPRYQQIRLTAQDISGKKFEMEADALLAICIQHEIDHLNGKLFIEYLSGMKIDRIRKKAIRRKKQPQTI